MNKRDNFTQKTIETLSKRVGGKCSNPNCRRETFGPHSNSDKGLSVGEAAHITAAAEGGPRYNKNLTSEQRKSADNGIWLCNICAGMIDSDENEYPVELLKLWKQQAEYEQYCKINNIENVLKTNAVPENRKNIGCRKIKESLEYLHSVLQDAYKYWELNFKDRYDTISLENELSEHEFLYKEKIDEFSNYLNFLKLLNQDSAQYALDIGPDICVKLNEYCECLRFSYSSDTCGLYNNYWSKFFENLSVHFNKLCKIKKELDNLFFEKYS